VNGETMKHTRGNLTIAGALTSYKGGCELAIHSPGGYLRMASLPYRKNIEDDARRFVALWNAAERLGLTTENIESGVLEKAFESLQARKEFILLANKSYRAETKADDLACEVFDMYDGG